MGRWVAVSFAAVLLIIAVDTADGHLFGRRKAHSAACYTCPIPQCPPADFCVPTDDGNSQENDAELTPGHAGDGPQDASASGSAPERLPEQPPADDSTSQADPGRAEEPAAEASDELADQSTDPPAARDAARDSGIPQAPEYGGTNEVPRYSAQPEPITPTVGDESPPPIAVETEPESDSDAGRYVSPPPESTNDILSDLFGPDDSDDNQSGSDDQVTGDPETGNPEESAGAEADADAEEAGAEADDPAENDAADEEKSPEELSNEDFFGVSAGQPDRVRLSNEEADPRVWNDITGLFSCSACVFDVSAEGVILSLAGGRQRLVEFSKLSTPDLLYLRELVVARRAELRDGSVSADRLAGPQAAGVR